MRGREDLLKMVMRSGGERKGGKGSDSGGDDSERKGNKIYWW